MSDGNKLAEYMTNSANLANDLSRKIVFAIIAVAWSISIKDGSFVPSLYVLWSLIFSLIFIILDIMYRILSSIYYRRIIKKYFVAKEGEGYVYKDVAGMDNINLLREVNCKTAMWQRIGMWWLIVMELFLIVSGVLLIIEIICMM